MKTALKKIVLLAFMLVATVLTFAQKGKGPVFEIVEGKTPCDTVWIVADKAAEYPGGFGEMYGFLYRKMSNPADLHPNIIKDRMLIKLLIDQNGTILDKKVLREIGQERMNDVLQAIDKFPKMIPAVKNGKNVCSYLIITVNFAR